MDTLHHFTLAQILEEILKLPLKEKQQLISSLLKNQAKKDDEQHDQIMTHFASEEVLARDWLTPEEDEAWKDL